MTRALRTGVPATMLALLLAATASPVAAVSPDPDPITPITVSTDWNFRDNGGYRPDHGSVGIMFQYMIYTVEGGDPATVAQVEWAPAFDAADFHFWDDDNDTSPDRGIGWYVGGDDMGVDRDGLGIGSVLDPDMVIATVTDGDAEPLEVKVGEAMAADYASAWDPFGGIVVSNAAPDAGDLVTLAFDRDGRFVPYFATCRWKLAWTGSPISGVTTRAKLTATTAANPDPDLEHADAETCRSLTITWPATSATSFTASVVVGIRSNDGTWVPLGNARASTTIAVAPAAAGTTAFAPAVDATSVIGIRIPDARLGSVRPTALATLGLGEATSKVRVYRKDGSVSSVRSATGPTLPLVKAEPGRLVTTTVSLSTQGYSFEGYVPRYGGVFPAQDAGQYSSMLARVVGGTPTPPVSIDVAAEVTAGTRVPATAVPYGIRVVRSTWFINGKQVATGTPGTDAHFRFTRLGESTLRVECVAASGKTYTASRKVIVKVAPRTVSDLASAPS